MRRDLNQEIAYVSLQLSDGYKWLHLRAFFETMQKRGDDDSNKILDVLYQFGNICRYVEQREVKSGTT